MMAASMTRLMMTPAVSSMTVLSSLGAARYSTGIMRMVSSLGTARYSAGVMRMVSSLGAA